MTSQYDADASIPNSQDIDMDETQLQSQAPAAAAAAVPVDPAGAPAARPRDSHTYLRWVFTLNNPGDFRPDFNVPSVHYAIYQLERGENGTPHLQGYIRFANRKRFTTVMRFLDNPRYHIEPARGSEQQCHDYCSKADTRIEAPHEFKAENFQEDQGKQGRRSDLQAVADELKANKPLKDIFADHPTTCIKFHAGVVKTAAMIKPLPPIARDKEVLVFWGETNTGKTHWAMTLFPGLYSVAPGRGPWDTYEGEETVLFDEFDWTQWPITDMNRFLDKWRCQLNCRYANKYLDATRVVICANSSPAVWYQGQGWNFVAALRRRLTTCYHFTREQGRVENIALLPQEPRFDTDGTELTPIPLNQ